MDQYEDTQRIVGASRDKGVLGEQKDTEGESWRGAPREVQVYIWATGIDIRNCTGFEVKDFKGFEFEQKWFISMYSNSYLNGIRFHR